MYGSAVADIFAMIIRVAIIIALAFRFNKIGYDINKFILFIIFIILFISVGLSFSYTQFKNQISFLNILYKFAILLAYIVIAISVNHKMLAQHVAALTKIYRKL